MAGALIAVAALALAGLGAGGAFASGGAPTTETEHTSFVGRTSVGLRASVNPNGSNVTECYFEYGTSESSLTERAPCSYLPGELETPVAVNATIEGLPESTQYFFRIHAKSGAGESSGEIKQFTTRPSAASVSNETPDSVAGTSATLRGAVNPNESEVTECYFEYGSVPSELNKRVECSPAPGAGGEEVQVHGAISGLAESTTYYFRTVAVNGFGLSRSGRGSFETLPAVPHANLEPAVSVTHTSATLRGFVNPNGSNIENCHFEYGTASPEEHTIPCEQTEIGAGTEPVAVTAVLSGLGESTTYRFRLSATNARGTGSSGTGSFTTLPYLPKFEIQKPAELADESALVRAKIDPQGQAITECTFEYGTTPALGKKASCNMLPPAGEKFTQVTAPLSGLTPNTTYLVRVKAVNASGPAYSHEESFTTFVSGLPPVVTKLKPKKGGSEGGNAVTVTGVNLLHAVSVAFGGTETTNITADSADSLTVIAPPGVGTVDVVVTTESGSSALSAGDRYTYGKPTITGISPNSGPVAGGTPVTVTGTGFEPGTTGTTFVFAKAAATSVECSSSSTCTMVVPADEKIKGGIVKVKAKVNGKASPSSPAATFTYEP